MAKTHTILQVFVASPSDVSEERASLSRVVTEFNNTWGSRNCVTLELLKWETSTHPAFGAGAQDVINKQIGDEYDIFIGIMWGRFGSPTERAESGTEEEYNRAYSRLSDSTNRIQIMFYFKDAGIPPSKIDPSQLEKVLNFKKKIANDHGGLYRSFELTEQFESAVRIHLSTVVQDWLDVNAPAPALSVLGCEETELKPVVIENPLCNLATLELESDEVGIIELVELATESMGEVGNIVERMTHATNDLGLKFTQRTEEAKKSSEGGPNIKAAKRISNKMADDLEIFVTRMSVEIKEFNKQSTTAMDAFGNIAMMSECDLSEDLEGITIARSGVQQYLAALIGSSESMSSFRESIFDLPRLTTSPNRARKRAVAIMDDLLNQIRITVSQTQDIDTLLKRLESTSNKTIPS